MISPISSLGSSLSSLAPIGGAGLPNASATPPADFANVLAEISTDAVGTLKNAETVAISGIEGKQSVQRVVQAIMSAEQTLQTAIAVRDKVVSAYQEISRMAI